MFPPASLLPSQEELMVDELLDLRGMPEPENKVEEKEEYTKEPSFIPFEKNESLLLSEISLPEENEATNLEWLSRFVHDCNSPEPPSSPPVTTSPASNSTFVIPIKSKRSKLRRTKAPFWSHEPCFASIPKKQGRKQRNLFAGNHGGGERQCTHCGVKRTPQWRAGPCGPKTLCNACGVRFKSGRLLPEYRPACSPTFMSKVHSNSHREVLEMRRKKDEEMSQPQLRRFILAEPTMSDLK